MNWMRCRRCRLGDGDGGDDDDVLVLFVKELQLLIASLNRIEGWKDFG
jgi:hypothetical protein